MGKLLSLQSQLQNAIGSTISKAEDQYLLLIQKTAGLTDRFYDTNRASAVKACRKLRELNGKAGETVASLIAKIEKEPTTETKVKNAVDKAAEATKSVVGKAAKAAGRVERVTAEVLS
jgi:uncharacterized protein HemX